MQQPANLDLQKNFREAFRVAGDIQEIVANRETAALLKRFREEPDVQKAAAELGMPKNSKKLSRRISMGKTLPAAVRK